MTARVQEKDGYFYVVFTYKDENGKRCEPWFNTNLKPRGNKKEALKLLDIAVNNFKPELLNRFKKKELNIFDPDMLADKPAITSPKKIQERTISETKINSDSDKVLFGDYLTEWLEIVKHTIEPNTYMGYKNKITRNIAPYFNKRGITLQDLTENDIQEYYNEELQRVKANTVIRYHANIRKCLEYARKQRLISVNVADFVEKPKVDKFISNYYNAEQLKLLFEKLKGNVLEIPVLIAGYYGLRRSEVVGLKWSNIDFYSKTVKIKHTIVMSIVDGKYSVVKRDKGKTNSSIRTLPLFTNIEERLKEWKKTIEENKVFFGNCYNREYEDYVCVLENGDIMRPDYITGRFEKALKKIKMPYIRFHDLRHSCAALQRHEGVNLEDIKEWLGHSNVLTTQKIYAHFENTKHLDTAQKIAKQLAQKLSD